MRRGLTDLARLERLRALLGARARVERTRLLSFSRAGFTRDVRAEVRGRRDVQLIDLERLYGGE